MERVIRIAILLFILLLPPTLQAQIEDEYWQSNLEQWSEHNETESIDEELIEMLDNLRENPINLNDTVSGELLILPFIDPLKYEALKAYIRQYGGLYSYAELALVRGFDSTTIRLLRPITVIAPIKKEEKFTLKDILSYGRSNLIVGSKRVLEKAQGYADSSYLGNPYRYYFRYQFKYRDRISFQLSGDKDPGEQFFRGTQPQGFDHYGIHLMLDHFGPIKRAIVGQYQLQFGQGLALWSGTAPWNTGNANLYRYAQGIRTASAFCEYGALEGVASTLAITPRLELTTFLSLARRDASLSDTNTWVYGISNTGYHRTANEIEKKDQLHEQLYGFNLHYQRTHLNIGLTATHTQFDKTIIPHEYIYNGHYFSGKQNSNLGLDFAMRRHNLICFGEMALSGRHERLSADSTFLPLAALAGAQFSPSSNHLISACIYYYSPSYQNHHASSPGQNDRCQNEQGISLRFQGALPNNIHTQMSVEYFHHPWMQYRVYSPSAGIAYHVLLEREFTSNLLLTLQYRNKISERNHTGTQEVGQIQRQYFQVSLTCKPDEQWQLISKVIRTWFDEELCDTEHGFLLSQDIIYKPTRIPIALSMRYLLFDVDDYDATIYAYERDILYETSTPSFTGQGYRLYALIKYNINPKMALELKYGRTEYFDRSTISSGDALLDYNHKQEIKVQLRVKF